MPPKKATTEQYKTLVNLIKECDCVRYGKGTPDQKKGAWESISATLNAIGGTSKTAEGWKKAYTEMKSHIKGKIRAGKSLNEIEKTCAEISGLYISCIGLPNVPELGGNTETVIVEEEVQGTEIIEGIVIQEEHPELAVFEQEPYEAQVEGYAQETAPTGSKQNGRKKKPDKSVASLLKEHIDSTNRGLQEIASSIQAVAGAINNVALAIRKSKE